jgi:Domain of unknown function (DUF4177)
LYRIRFSSLHARPAITNQLPKKEHAMKEYKVLTEKDGRYNGRFNGTNLEAALNSYGAEGWQAVTISRDAWAGMKVKVLIILERDRT